MKPTIIGLGLVLSTQLLVGCVTRVPDHRPVDPAACYGLDTISFSPPSGSAWSFFEGRDKQVKFKVFLQRGESPPQGFVVGVVEVVSTADIQTPDQMWSHVVEPVCMKILSAKRYDITSKSVDAFDRFASPSIRYYMTARDFGAPDRGDVEFISLRAHGFALAHPDKKNTFVVIEFMERGHEAQLSEDTETRAMELLNGLVFQPCQ